MLRACQKTTLHMRELQSPFFEEAFFVLRRDMPHRAECNNLAAEAERIAAEYSRAVKSAPVKKHISPAAKNALFFAAGALSAAAGWAAFMLL